MRAQNFCQYRGKISSKTPEELELLKRCEVHTGGQRRGPPHPPRAQQQHAQGASTRGWLRSSKHSGPAQEGPWVANGVDLPCAAGAATAGVEEQRAEEWDQVLLAVLTIASRPVVLQVWRPLEVLNVLQALVTKSGIGAELEADGGAA